jgi:hypothetical protein
MHEVVRISKECAAKYQDGVTQLTILQLRMELETLQDLVKILDPDHHYVFASEYGGFIKTERKATDG